jgi:hypothetical protein
MDKKEKVILKYLELTYGNREVYESETSVGINRVLIYHKSLNQIGVVGKAHLDLVNWFGPGNYHKVVGKWFSEKHKLYVIPLSF